MVKSKKSLLGLILLLILNSFIYSQDNTEAETNSESSNIETVNTTDQTLDFENNPIYFGNTDDNESSAKAKNPSLAGLVFKMIIFLALVVAAIYAIMFFFKKKNNEIKSEDDFLRKVSSLTLSPGKSIEIVTMIDKGYILGVTDGSINLISEIDDKELIQALNLNFDKKQSTKKPNSFAEVLDMFLVKNKKNNTNIYSEAEKRVNNLNKHNNS